MRCLSQIGLGTHHRANEGKCCVLCGEELKLDHEINCKKNTNYLTRRHDEVVYPLMKEIPRECLASCVRKLNDNWMQDGLVPDIVFYKNHD